MTMMIFNSEQICLNAIKLKIQAFNRARNGQYPVYDFNRQEIEGVFAIVKISHSTFGGSDSDICN